MKRNKEALLPGVNGVSGFGVGKYPVMVLISGEFVLSVKDNLLSELAQSSQPDTEN